MDVVKKTKRNQNKKAKKNVNGVENVTADHSTGKVIVISNNEVSEEIIKETLEDIGYEIVKEDQL